jgi:hypothetical protein
LSETQILLREEQQRMKNIVMELNSICKNEEIGASQRSRERDILEGEKKTTCFEAMENQSMRLFFFLVRRALWHDN